MEKSNSIKSATEDTEEAPGMSVDPSILGNHIRKEESIRSRRSSRKKIYALAAFFLACLVALAIALPLTLLDNGENYSMPDYITNEEDIDVALLLAKESGKNIVYKPGTPQHKAMIWLIFSDPMKLKIDSENLLQRYALATLYYATRGEDWTENENWLNGVNECYWHGVKCFGHGQVATNFYYGDQILDPVTEIILESNNLVTLEIPIEIILLRDVRILNMADNKIYAEFPTWIGKMRNLRELKLNDNLINGKMTKHMDEIKSLEKLDLSSNVMSGSIRHEIGSIKTLKELNIADNFMTNSLPKEIYYLTDLKVLSCRNSGLRGTISPSLSKLRNLEILDLGENYFTGTVGFDVLDPLTNLEAIFLDVNGFEGSLPAIYGAKLKKINYHNNLFEGSIPFLLENLNMLTHLDLSYNLLEGSIITGISGDNHPKLTHLLLQGNRFTGTLPSELFTLNLEVLHGGNNLLTGRISPSIGDLGELTALRLDDNNFFGPIPWDELLSGIENLEILGLHNNKGLTGEIPDSIGGFTKLRDLALGGNELKGTIPASIGDLHNLRHLWIEDLDLTGSVPIGVCALWEHSLKSFMSDCVEVECTCCTGCGPL